MSSVMNPDVHTYKVVLVKTIEGAHVIYYRVVNLSTYKTEIVPAYRFFDFLAKKKVTNVRVENNKIYITDSNDYDSTEEIIVFDEFDDEVVDLYAWALSHGTAGKEVITQYSSQHNKYSLSNYTINSEEQIAWECKRGHVVYCDFATYYGTGCKCPICEAKEHKKVISLKQWAKLTRHPEILEAYDEACELNELDSKHIAWNSRKTVTFRKGTEVVTERLSDVTGGNTKIEFRTVTKINLSRVKPSDVQEDDGLPDLYDRDDYT